MKPSIHDKATSITWALLWMMLPLSLRGSLLFLWLFGFFVLYRVFKKETYWPNKNQRIAAGLFVLFLLWQGISLFFDTDQTLWWKALEKKSALLIVPLLLSVVNQEKLKLETWAIRGFMAGLLVAAMAMVVVAAYRTIYNDGFLPWSYHEFAAPIPLGAIYASWYYSSALIYLVFRNQDSLIEQAKPYLLFFFLVVLFLLASKLFIIFTVPLVFWKLFRLAKLSRKNLFAILAVLVVVISVSSPFLYRMSELKNTKLTILKQDSFAYDTPFNGLTFRLLQWRFATEILNENEAWFTGIGLNSSQAVLDAHYQKKGIYTGNPDLGDSGYLGYNFHNQYLETLVGTGVPGLLILLLIIFFIFFRLRSKLLFPLHVYLITTLFFFTESVLERQAGILFFCLIVFVFSIKSSKRNGSNPLTK